MTKTRSHLPRAGIALVFLALFVAALFLFRSGARKKETADYRHPALEPSGPNIILIVTDDQDQASLAAMPQTRDLIVQRGVTFTNAFVASPVCIPSRASLLLGQYVHRHGVAERASSFANHEQRTMATMMKDRGYETALVGKYFNGDHKPAVAPPGWDRWRAIVDDNRYYDYRLNEDGRLVHYGNSETDYISDVLARKSVEFLEQRDSSRPFFLYLGAVAPHSPTTPAPEYAATAVTQTEFRFEDDLTDKPAWVREFRAVNAAFLDQSWPHVGPWLAARQRTLLSVDDMVGQLVATLERTGQLDNTFIFFISDNGDGVSRHIPASPKLMPYEEGIRTPLVVSGPGVAKGAAVSRLVSSVDLLPTLAELAGAKIPAATDGRSLVPLFAGQDKTAGDSREAVVAELGEVSEWPWKSVPPMYRLLRGSHWKYIEYVTGEREYYDLAADPGEELNLYGNLAEDFRTELAGKMQRLAPWPEWETRAQAR